MAEGMTCYERDEVFCEDQMCLRVGCRLQNERLSAESKTPAKFTITWEGGRYFVSIPNYKGGEVVPADLVEPLVEALRECVELFGDIRSDFSDPRSVCDKGRDIAEAAILRARQAADTEPQS